ncbi:MAG: DUF2341 domain-containing protein [Kiritimatiellae bacterium]|nr:DUF2341 domain-containing protein [Kiritimatiellia bacterium]
MKGTRRKFHAIGIGLLLCGAALPRAARADRTDWYMNPIRDFAYRQEIVISGSLADGVLTNFPLLVAITNQDNPVFVHAQSNGDDIAFAAADTLTSLACEIEVYTNSCTRQLIAWVNMPVLLPGQSTTILMLYGNPSLPSQQNVAGVWTNDFLGVWHLNEAMSAGGTNYDSSASQAHAVRYGSAPSGAAGKIGGGNAYNGSDDYSGGPGVALDTNGFTVSAWCYLTDTNNIFYAIEVGNDPAEYLGLYGTGQPLFSIINTNPPPAFRQVGTFGPPQTIGEWHYVVGVARPTYNQLFVDGVDVGTAWGTPAGLAWFTHCQYIGGTPGSRWQGSLDELRMCGEARSAAWIRACYRNQGNPDAYLAVGAESVNRQWDFRQKVTISAAMVPNTDQVGFPVLVLITNRQHDVFAQAQSNGADILFTTEDRTNKLPHQIETFSAGDTSVLAAWVRVPVLSHTSDTTLYMYYGNPTAMSQADPDDVWTNNFLGVWHLNEAVSAGGTNCDSSLTRAHALRYGTPGGTDGKIGGGNAYNGAGDFSAGPGVAVNTNGFTLSAWVYPRQEGLKMIECGAATPDYLCTVDGAVGLFSQHDSVPNQITTYSAPLLTASNWHYVVAVASPTAFTFYVDGNHAGVQAANGVPTCSRAVYIGHYVTRNDIDWNGMLDEMRVCGVPRSADWIKTCYNNQGNPDGFLSYGLREGRLRGLTIMLR